MNIGIDLGTTYSVVSYVDSEGNVKIITNSEGSRITPSAIFFDDKKVIVGEVAKKEKEFTPENVVDVVKRTMGTDVKFFHGEKYHNPEELSSYILKKLVKDAEAELNEKVTGAVITVPAYFNDKERQATIDAAEIAGLKVLQIINEPTAAAFAYGYENDSTKESVLVYDLGGGTFDITLLGIVDKGVNIISTDGNHRLGGVDFDAVIIDHFVEEIDEEFDYDVEDDDELMAELEIEAERIKKGLTSKDKERLALKVDGEKFKGEYTRHQFEEAISPLIDNTVNQVRACILEADYNVEDIQKILLVGGSTRVPLIEEKLSIAFGLPISKELNPDEVVSIGAAILAAKLGESDIEFEEKTNKKLSELEFVDINSIGIGLIANKDDKKENFVIVEKHTELPAFGQRTFYTSIENQKFVNIQITEGDDSDLDFVEIVANATATLPDGREKGSPLDFQVGIDTNGCIVVTVIDGINETVLSTVEVEKRGSLSKEEKKKLIEINKDKEVE